MDLGGNELGKRSANAMILLSRLFKSPIVDVKQVSEFIGVSYKAANDLVSDFEKLEILQELTGQTRNRVFIFNRYVTLFAGDHN